MRPTLSDRDLDQCVTPYIRRVGHAYGRRTMHGLLRSNGIHVCQARLAASLRQLAPVQYHARSVDTYRMLNPMPYRALYYGHKLHLDQNEKLVRFGVTHVLAVDGYSRRIVGFITLSIKNAIAIYDLLFRPLLLEQGMWDQIRVDHGSEFALIISVQQSLAPLRHSQGAHPVLQSMSRQNHRAERLWLEINQRINYPVKQILTEMENNGEINMEDEVTKFSVSRVTILVIETPIKNISAWNCHRIPGRNGGIPIELSRNNQVTRLDPTHVPSTSMAVAHHQLTGSRLSPVSCFGQDPLHQNTHLQHLRDRDFTLRVPEFGVVFEAIVLGNAQPFKDAIHHLISLSHSFSSLL